MLRRNSSFEPSGLNRKKPWRKLMPLAADLAVEAGVADDAVDPVVEAVAQVARPGVGVARAPAGEQDLAHVGLAVAVGVLEEQRVRGLVRRSRRRWRSSRLVGMLSLSAKTVNLSALPSPSVSSQIDDPVAALALRLQLVGVVDRLGDPQPAALVPVHAIGLPISRLGDEQLRLEARRASTMCFMRLLGRRAASASCVIGSPSVPHFAPGG